MRTFYLYKRMLTVQVLLLGAHHLMSGGFADGSRYSRASHAVLSGGDPIRERLARHLHRPRLPPPLLQEIKRRRSRFHPHRLGWSTPALPAPAARRLSPPPTPPWHRLLGPATRQALLLVHRGPGLSSTRKVVLASCHCPASPHPEAAATSRPRSVIQGCPRNPIPWCGTRCASGLLRTPRPGARTSRCRGGRSVSPSPSPHGSPQGRGHLPSVLGLRRLVLPLSPSLEQGRPEPRRASPFSAGSSESRQPRPRPVASAPPSCHPAVSALLRARGLSLGSPGPNAGEGTCLAQRTHPASRAPQPGRRAGWLVAAARRPRVPGPRCSQPRPGPWLSSAVPAPVPSRCRLRQRRRVSLALGAASPSPPPPQLERLRRVR